MTTANVRQPSGGNGNSERPNTYRVAQEQIAKGRLVLPIPFGKKIPDAKDWQNTEFSVQDFTHNPNIGIKLDHTIEEVDCDHAYTRELARHLLTKTAMTHGRPSKGISHYWYEVVGDGIHEQFADVPDADNKRKMLVELRGGHGKMTIIPPSTYFLDDGGSEQLIWGDGGEGTPQYIEIEDLRTEVEKIATIALIALHWNGARHEIAKAVAGLLIRGGVEEDTIFEIIDWVTRLTRDEESSDRMTAVGDTIKKFAIGEQVTGGKTLSELVGAQVTTKIFKWMHLGPVIDETGGEKNLLKFEASDTGNAEAVQCLYGSVIHHSPAVGWMVYTGTHWHHDSEKHLVEQLVDQMVVDTLRKRRTQAVARDNEAVIKCSKPDNSRVNACKARLKSLKGIYIDINEFDSVPYQLNTASGVVDMRTEKIEPHSSAQKFTYCLKAKVGTPEDAEPFVAFLRAAVNNSGPMLDYIQRAVGYSITGYTREEILFYLYGPTRSGKGTFNESLLALLGGTLSSSAEFNAFTAKRETNDQGFDLAVLRSARFVVASESNKYQSLNPAKIKQLTGGDEISCALKHKDFFTFRPQFKVWLISNHPVNADPDDDAAWGRVRVIPFPNSHLGSEDKTLKHLMKSEKVQQGILWWAIRGAWLWLNSPNGLETPQEVKDSTREQRALSDYVQQWIDECAELSAEAWTSSEKVMASYLQWCKNNNVEPKQSRGLASSLQQKGCTPSVLRREGNDKIPKRGYMGIKVSLSITYTR